MEKREEFQKKIWELTTKAQQYAIPPQEHFMFPWRNRALFPFPQEMKLATTIPTVNKLIPQHQ